MRAGWLWCLLTWGSCGDWRVQRRMATWEAGCTSGPTRLHPWEKEKGLTLGCQHQQLQPSPFPSSVSMHLIWPQRKCHPGRQCVSVCVCVCVCVSSVTCRALPLTVLQFLMLISAPFPTLSSHTFKQQQEGLRDPSERSNLPLPSCCFPCVVQPGVSSAFFYAWVWIVSTFYMFINITDWLLAHLFSSQTFYEYSSLGFFIVTLKSVQEGEGIIPCPPPAKWNTEKVMQTSHSILCSVSFRTLNNSIIFHWEPAHHYLFSYFFICIHFSLFILRKYATMNMICSYSFCLHFSCFLWINSQK